MIYYNSVTALCFMWFPLVAGISFSSIGIGGGISSAQHGVLGASSVLGDGNFASIGTAASGSMVSGSTSVISPVEATKSEELSSQTVSPEEPSSTELSSILGRGLQADVPDYREASVSPGNTYTTSGSGNGKTRSNENVSSKTAGNTHPHKVCWTMSKRCCYEEVQNGYECKDFYAYKYARCHPVIAYEQICGEIRERPAHHPRPKGRVKYEETVLKNYDAKYGPHVEGYPEGGESEFYRTSTIPTKPHGVSGTPFPAPQSYQSGNGGVTNGGYEATSNGNTLSVAPYQTTNNIQTSGATSPEQQKENTTTPMYKNTESAKTDPGNAYKVNAKHEQGQGKALMAKSDGKTKEAGQDQTKASHDTQAAPTSSPPGNGPSYRIATRT